MLNVSISGIVSMFILLSFLSIAADVIGYLKLCAIRIISRYPGPVSFSGSSSGNL